MTREFFVNGFFKMMWKKRAQLRGKIRDANNMQCACRAVGKNGPPANPVFMRLRGLR